MNIVQFIGAIELGLIFGLVAMGVYISFRILDFPDLTADGSFPLGAAVSGTLIIANYDPWTATLAAMICGAAAGLFTAWLNTRWKILHLLASILTMTALYSINLRIMGKPNLAIMSEDTVFTKFSNEVIKLTGPVMDHGNILVVFLVIITALVIFGLSRFFSSEVGLAMRATGKSPRMATAQGIRIGAMTLLGIAMSNAIIALSGSLFTQTHGFADISMGTGTIIVGLAAVIIGEAIMHTRSILIALFACVIGSILYRMVIALALNSDFLGLEASDERMVTAGLVALAMILSHAKSPIKNLLNKKRSAI